MAITASQAQGLVLALFGASAGAHLTGLTSAASVSAEAADLVTAAGLVLDRDLSSNTTFRDLVLVTNLKLTGAALTAAQAWMDGEFTKGTSRGDIITAAVTFLDGLTDTTNTFYATAAAYRTTVANAVTWSQGAGATVTSVATLMAQQGTSSSAPGQSFTLTTGTDTLVGTNGNDTFTGDKTTFAAADQIVDQFTNDNDTYNLTVDAAPTPKATNVENVNVALNTASGVTVDASSLTGTKNLTVTGTDYTVGGATITSSKAITVTGVNATKVAQVTAGAGTTTLSVTQATKAGATIDASTATSTIAVTGAATLSADASKSTVTVTALNNATEDAKAVSVNAANATSVTIAANTGKFSGTIGINAAAAGTVTVNNLTTTTSAGAVTVNAAKATSVTVDDAAGGATVNAATTNTANATISVSNITNKGATVTAGSGNTTSKTLGITLDGSSAGAADDAATVSASGTVTLTTGATNLVETLNLSGNGADVTYALHSTSAIKTIAASGTAAVNVNATAAQVAGKTVTGAGTVKLTASVGSTATTLDLSKVGASTIEVNADLVNTTPATLNTKVANGAVLNLTAVQTGLTLNTATAADSITVKAGDSNGASNTATPTTTVGAVDITAVGGSLGKGTLNLVATESHLTATSLTGSVTNAAGDTITAASSSTKAQAAVVITGNKNVTLGNVTAKTVDASGLTGNLSMTAYNQASTVTAGSGSDTIALDDNGNSQVFTLDAGNGDNSVTITAAANNTTVVSGGGADTVTIASGATATYVVSTGAGDDTVNLNQGSGGNVVLALGDGTGDKVVFGTGMSDYSGNADFAITGVEVYDITSRTSATTPITISAAQFAKDNTFKLTGNSATTDVLLVKNTSSSAGATIDASGVTYTSAGADALLKLQGGIKTDTITGSAGADYINATAGADSIDGGAGTDTVDFSGLSISASNTNDVETGATATTTGAQVGIVVNLSATTVAASTIASALSLYTADAVTTVDSGKTAYLYAAQNTNTVTNSAVQQSLASVEAIVGTGGKDYLVAGSNGNTITGGAGNDYVKLGAGADKVVFTDPSTGGSDTVASFTGGADKLQFLESAFGTTATWSSHALITTSTATSTYFEVTTDVAATGVDLNAAGTTTTGFVVVGATTGTAGVKVYYTTDVGDFKTANSTLIATLVGLNTGDIAATDFVGV